MKLILLLGLAFFSSFARADVLDQLKALPGVSAQESTTSEDRAQGLRRFTMTIEQAVDHFSPESATFPQKLVLLHRDFAEPMVLQTSGYVIFGVKLSALARTFATNQLQVEHRFFGDSVPENKDWKMLTVRQSAADFHQIVETFKKLYPARWVNTGRSKGGMTSIFHRRFYPGDLDGTLAEVAPISYATEDSRYINFVDHVGGDAYLACRARLYEVQSTLLRRRAEIEPGIAGEFSMVGSLDRAFEDAVLELPFIFWQYGNPADSRFGCDHIPAPDASADDLAAFLDAVNGVDGYNNKSMEIFQPYYLQAAYELGGPATKLDHLQGQVLYPYDLAHLLPAEAQVEFTPATMRDIQAWVAGESHELMFVYGEFDPWTAGAFRTVNQSAGTNNYWYQQPRGNHGSSFAALPAEDRTEALEVLGRWLNKKPAALLQGFLPMVEDGTLEELEIKAMRKQGIRN